MQRNKDLYLQRGPGLVEVSATLAVVTMLAGAAVPSLRTRTRSACWSVCRYAADVDRSGGVRKVVGSDVTDVDNQEHPYAYLNAQESLPDQNFLVIPGQRSCTSAGVVEVDGQHGANYTGGSTVTHQP
jgi:hypothetical protein